MIDKTTLLKCACGSQSLYAKCCQPYHAGEKAPTPEALMRSRFTAFVLQLEDYLLASWHPSTRPAELNLESASDWVALHILSSSEQGTSGQVDFKAIYRLASGWGYLQEVSEFAQEGGWWYYLKGEIKEGLLKPRRNEPCPCASGKKFKSCCLD